LGNYDFSCGPYALGDALTGQMNLAVLTEEHGCAAIDQYLLIDEKHPASRRLQPNVYPVVSGERNPLID
jgi:hypothetical protein